MENFILFTPSWKKQLKYIFLNLFISNSRHNVYSCLVMSVCLSVCLGSKVQRANMASHQLLNCLLSTPAPTAHVFPLRHPDTVKRSVRVWLRERPASVNQWSTLNENNKKRDTNKDNRFQTKQNKKKSLVLFLRNQYS